jgi:hypothetical protein
LQSWISSSTGNASSSLIPSFRTVFRRDKNSSYLRKRLSSAWVLHNLSLTNSDFNISIGLCLPNSISPTYCSSIPWYAISAILRS